MRIAPGDRDSGAANKRRTKPCARRDNPERVFTTFRNRLDRILHSPLVSLDRTF